MGAEVFHIGCHLSFSKGYLAMGREALSIGANAFQYFSRNPRGGATKDFDAADAAALETLAKENDFAPFLVHAPYTINPCSADAKTREFAFTAFAQDLEKQQNVPNSFYNFHPGSHVGQGVDVGIEMIAEVLNKVVFDDIKTVVLLETMSGKGSEVGSTFAEIRRIIDAVEKSKRDALGVCLDTCHVYSAGYDIVGNLDGVLDEFDSEIGLERLCAIHLNDSLTPFDSHKDRHAKIGEGSIGADAIVRFINHPKLRNLPFYLETPNELEGYATEISFLRSKRK